jgi:hypothetical protein
VYPAYSPNLVPADFWLFYSILIYKKILGESDMEEVREVVSTPHYKR